MFIVIDGRLSLSRGGGASIELGPGDHAGEAILLHPRPARATLRAVEPSQLLVIERDALWEMIRARPYLGIELLERLGLKLGRHLDRAVLELHEGKMEGDSGYVAL